MKKIPFKNEVREICQYIHLNPLHGNFNKCQHFLLNSEFYWEGYSSDMKSVIYNCITCVKLNKSISNKPKMLHIIPEGPHYRYQADLWELNKDIAKKIKYKYILEVKDCFSKWLWSYPLYDKTGESVLRGIKNFFLAFGKPAIIQTDNGLEFNNQTAEIYYENNSIKHINSSPRYPVSNWQIEAQHKTLQKAIKIGINENPNSFNIEDCINKCLEVYNYQTIHSTTGYIPFFLKDINDLKVIDNVKYNIKKCYETFQKNDSFKYLKGDKYLLIENGVVNKNNLIYPPKNKKSELIYSIPVTISENENGGLLKIIIDCKNKYYKINNEYTVN